MLGVVCWPGCCGAKALACTLSWELVDGWAGLGAEGVVMVVAWVCDVDGLDEGCWRVEGYGGTVACDCGVGLWVFGARVCWSALPRVVGWQPLWLSAWKLRRRVWMVRAWERWYWARRSAAVRLGLGIGRLEC